MPATNSPPQEATQHVTERFWETMPAVWSHIRTHLRSLTAEQFEISLEQFNILRHLRSGARSMSDLAAERHISRPAISQSVEVLVERGLVTRQDRPSDRRYVELELTPTGRALLEAVFVQTQAWMAEKLAGLSPSEIENIVLGMQALKKAFDEPHP